MSGTKRILQGLSLLISFFLSACLPQKEMIYFQATDTSAKQVAMDTTLRLRIQKNDVLSIYVSSVSEEASRFFNYTTEAGVENSTANNYVVDAMGSIQLPLIGSIAVEGLTLLEARDTVKRKLEKYLTDPTVKLNLVNFRVTVLGEVNHPGNFTVDNEKMNLTDALALAGDLTVYARRNNILVIRETGGKKEFGNVDLTSRNLFASPLYHLQSNDIVYVESLPQKKETAQTYYRVLPMVLSGLSLIVVLVSLTHN